MRVPLIDKSAPKMTTYLQNVCIVETNGDETWTHVQERPVCPVDITLPPEWIMGYSEDNRYYGVLKDGMMYRWYLNGEITMHSNGRLWAIWYPKPTLDDIVHSPNGEMYVQFHQDGSVDMKHDDKTYFWGPEVPGTPVIGRGAWQLDVGYYYYSGISPGFMLA